MLQKIRLHNFRTYLNAELSFTPLHLVIGKNNSGKTNLMSGIRFLSATAYADLSKAITAIPGADFEATNWTTSSDTFEIGCECTLPVEGEPCVFSYSLEIHIGSVQPTKLSKSELSSARIVKEELRVRGKSVVNQVLLHSDGKIGVLAFERPGNKNTQGRPAPLGTTLLSKVYDTDENLYAVVFREYLASWLFFDLSPRQMRFGWKETESLTAELSVDGSNLAVVLHNVKSFDERRYRRIVEAVQQIEPELESLGSFPSPGQPPVPFIVLRDRERASWVGLSDGTLRYLAFAYLAELANSFQTNSEDLPIPPFFIEEPENGIFPGQLRTLFELIESRGGGGQWVFTSHSPYFINLFDSRRDAVTVLRKAGDRTEVITPTKPDDCDPDRPLLAEEYSMELFD